METTFVKFKKYVTTEFGRVSRGLITEIPSKEAKEFCSRGLCEIPNSVSVTYRGEQNKNSYVLNWRKLRIVFTKDIPRIVPRAIIRNLQGPAFVIKPVKH